MRNNICIFLIKLIIKIFYYNEVNMLNLDKFILVNISLIYLSESIVRKDVLKNFY